MRLKRKQDRHVLCQVFIFQADPLNGTIDRLYTDLFLYRSSASAAHFQQNSTRRKCSMASTQFV